MATEGSAGPVSLGAASAAGRQVRVANRAVSWHDLPGQDHGLHLHRLQEGNRSVRPELSALRRADHRLPAHLHGGADRREVPDHRAPRPRRDGRGLQGAAHAPRRDPRHQDDAAAPDGGPVAARALPPGSEAGDAHPAPERRGPPRLLPARGQLPVHGVGVHRGHEPRGHGQARGPAEAARGHRHRDPDAARPRGHPRGGHHPPRHQPREHHGLQGAVGRAPREGHRPRHREVGSGGRRRHAHRDVRRKMEVRLARAPGLPARGPGD